MIDDFDSHSVKTKPFSTHGMTYISIKNENTQRGFKGWWEGETPSTPYIHFFDFPIERKFGGSKYIQNHDIPIYRKKTMYTSKVSIPLHNQHCNLHCIRAGFRGFIEVAFRQEQVLRQPLPHLVQVAHVEQRLQCPTEAVGGMEFGGIFDIRYSVLGVCGYSVWHMRG